MISLPFSVRVYNLTYQGEIPMGLDDNYKSRKEFSDQELFKVKIVERKLGGNSSEYFVILRNKKFFILNEKERKIFVDLLRQQDESEYSEIEAV